MPRPKWLSASNGPQSNKVCFAVQRAVEILDELGEARLAIYEFTGYHAR